MGILYLKCLCGRNRLLASRMKEEGYDIRVTSKNTEWRRQAAEYKAKLPFTVLDGRVTEI